MDIYIYLDVCIEICISKHVETLYIYRYIFIDTTIAGNLEIENRI